MDLTHILQIVLLIGFPYVSMRISEVSIFKQWLSPIILCYALGIVLRNWTNWPLDDQLSKQFVEGSIIFAVPMLLYSTNIFKWLHLTKKALFSFSLCALSSILGTIIAYYYFKDGLTEAQEISGMFTGLYIGGTANVQAIGLALNANPENVVLISTADIVVGGIYLIFLTTIARSFFGLYLPDYQPDDQIPEDSLEVEQGFYWKESIAAFGLTIVLIGMVLGLTYLVNRQMNNTGLIMLLLTSAGIAASFLPFVKKWQSTYVTAEYLLLIFSVGLGMMADFSTIMDQGLLFIGFDALILLLAVFFHSLFAYFYKIDKDTFLITSVAGFYGTPFVAQVGTLIGNRKVIFDGILMSLLGYMVGNYLGIGVTWLLKIIG